MRPVKWLGEKPFHTLLLLTERPARWATWQILPVLLLVAAGAGLVWTGASQRALIGGSVACILVLFALADWGLLSALPRWGVSFGPVHPPWLALVLFRGLLSLAGALPGRRWPGSTLILLSSVHFLVTMLLSYGMLVEPFRLQVTRVQISSAKLSNLDAPVRILQLSDLHVERLTRRERALPGLVAALAPDLIVITGDFLNTSYLHDPRALADLRTLLVEFTAPAGIFAVWGTPEVDLPHRLRPVLKELGIVPLEDEALELAIHGQKLWLMGLSCTLDPTEGGSKVRSLLADKASRAFVILLHHTPDLMPHVASLGIDLYLAGHTHGGQWRVPGFGALLTSSRYWKRYESGLCREGSAYLYVSRGVGMEGFGTPRSRFFCPPEAALITLVGTADRCKV